MSDNRDASPEVREAINSTLREILSTDGWGQSFWDGVVKNLKDEFGINTDLLALAQRARCLPQMLEFGALVDNGFIGVKTQQRLSQIIHKLLRIALRAEHGEEKAANQLIAIHKIAHPFNYELPATVIKNLADSYHISPHLARAWDVRDLMLDLSWVVEPTRSDKSVLDGRIKLANRTLRMPHEDLYEKAVKHIREGSTLQSLAIAIYLEQLESEGIFLDTNQIKRDLRKLKEWESTNLTDEADYIPIGDWVRYPRAHLPPIPIYSDGWKRLWRRGYKDRESLP